ncbi:MAG: cytidylate kinase-like family protein [Gemmatimonadaceae bacterium]|jgi:cytidylate kinase|nr:cytidylate kinase-like family protein [Gemmatimonadaceae bacterium]
MQYDLITISREYGAGASELAVRLGADLGWQVLDVDIALAVADRLGVSRDSLAQWDEHAPGFFENIGGALMVGTPELPVDALVASRPQARDVAATTRDFLVEAAALQPSIIVGHGAQAIFAERPRTLRVRLVAPIAERSRRVATRRGCTEKEAVAMAHHFDHDRAHYVKAFHGRDVTDPLLYTLQINTGEIAMPDAVTIVRAVLGSVAG